MDAQLAEFRRLWGKLDPKNKEAVLAAMAKAKDAKEGNLAEASPVRMDLPTDPERPAARSRRKGRN